MTYERRRGSRDLDTGASRKRTASTALKMTEFAPIPRASVTMTVAVKVGARSNVRIAYRKILFHRAPMLLWRVKEEISEYVHR